MFIALYIYLVASILGDIWTIYNVGTNRTLDDGMRFFGVMWEILWIFFAIFLIILIANR